MMSENMPVWHCTLPEEYAYGQGDPLYGDPDDWPVEVLLGQAGARLLQLKGVDKPKPEVGQGEQGNHVAARMLGLSLPGHDDGEKEEFCHAEMLNM